MIKYPTAEEVLEQFAELGGEYKIAMIEQSPIYKHEPGIAPINITPRVVATTYEIALSVLRTTLIQRNAAEALILLMEGITTECHICNGGEPFNVIDGDTGVIKGRAKPKHRPDCAVNLFVSDLAHR